MLTWRETQVLKLIASGLTNREIADKLNLKPNTIEFHTGIIFDKLNIYRRVLLVHYAISTGLVECQRFDERKVA